MADAPVPARLSIAGVSKSYAGARALEDISFEVQPGEVHALLGHNGAGKSTLVKILSGLVQPDAGTVAIDGQVVEPRNPRHAQALGVALVDQELSLVATLSVEENLRLGAARSAASMSSSSLRTILDSLGLDHVRLSDSLGELPIGERQLVEIARALSRDAKILILDEPTATLSEREIEMVFKAVRKMAADGRSIIYVSHRLGEILELCQRATVFRDGRRISTESVSTLDRDSIVTMMLGHLPDMSDHGVDGFSGDRDHVVISGLTVPPRLRAFDLAIGSGQIVGIAGQVGCGASEVLRGLAGLIPEAQGAVQIRGAAIRLGSPMRSARAGVLYCTNDRKDEGLFLSHSIVHNLVSTRLPRLGRLSFIDRRRHNTEADQLLGLTAIPTGRRKHAVGSLSGGNQQKVLIARSLNSDSSALLLMDEPTRGVDVGGRAEIHNLIRGAAGCGNAVLFSSTELDEVMELSDIVVTMFGGRVVGVHERRAVTPATVLTEMTHGAQLVGTR